MTTQRYIDGRIGTRMLHVAIATQGEVGMFKATRRTLILLVILTLGLAPAVQPLAAVAVTSALVVAWGYNGDGQTNVPAGLSAATAIAGGDQHSLALK